MTSSAGAIKVEFNLFTLRRELEIAKKREYTWEEIAQRAELHPNTLYNLAANRSKRIDVTTIEKLVNFFRSEGLAVNPGNLFQAVPVGGSPSDSVSQEE